MATDALRFYLMREVQWGQDGDVTWEGLHRRYEGELANDLGNLVSRATSMIGRYRGGASRRATTCSSRSPTTCRRRLDAVDLTGALEQIWGLCGRPTGSSRSGAVGAGQVRRPADAARLDETLYTLADTVR